MSQQTILCVSHVAPWPASHGNEIRLQRLLLWFRQQNYRLILVLTQPQFDPEQQDLIRKHVDQLEIASPRHPLLQFRNRRDKLHWMLHSNWPGRQRRTEPTNGGAMKRFADQLCPVAVNTLVRRMATKESIDIFFSYYAFTLHAFAGLSRKTMLLCDSIEIFSMERFDEAGKLIPPVLSFSAEEERNLLMQSDYLIAIQAAEAAYLSQLIPEKRILTVGMDCDLPGELYLPSEAGEVIGIVGSDNLANREGLDLFLVDSWPRIKSSRPQAKLLIAGKLGRQLQAQDQDQLPEGVTPLGWVASLSAFYQELRIVVNPVQRGTGLKIKTVEALAHGRPLVAYPVGLEGINWASVPLPWSAVNTPEAMANACIALLADPRRCDAMAESARQFAVHCLSADTVYAPLATLLGHPIRGQVKQSE
ncbi:MAG: glycosyltransferase [Cyanobacteriota bacterium]